MKHSAALVIGTDQPAAHPSALFFPRLGITVGAPLKPELGLTGDFPCWLPHPCGLFCGKVATTEFKDEEVKCCLALKSARVSPVLNVGYQGSNKHGCDDRAEKNRYSPVRPTKLRRLFQGGNRDRRRCHSNWSRRWRRII